MPLETLRIQTSNNILILHNLKRNYKKHSNTRSSFLFLKRFFSCTQLHTRENSTYSNLALKTRALILPIFGNVQSKWAEPTETMLFPMCFGPQTLKTPQCMGRQEQAKLNSTFTLNTGSAVGPAGAGWPRPLARRAREAGLDTLRVCFSGCSGWPGKLISWHSALDLPWLCVLASHCSQISPSWSTGSLADAAAVPEAGEEACGAAVLQHRASRVHQEQRTCITVPYPHREIVFLLQEHCSTVAINKADPAAESQENNLFYLENSN